MCFTSSMSLVKSYSLAILGRLRHARQALSQAQERLRMCQGSDPSGAEAQQAQAVVEARAAQVQHWETVDSAYRQHLESVSLLVHPWRLVDSTRQTSHEVEHQLHAEIAALEVLSRNAWVARQKEGGGQGAQAARWRVRLGGLVVAGSVARCAAHGPHAAVEAMD